MEFGYFENAEETTTQKMRRLESLRDNFYGTKAVREKSIGYVFNFKDKRKVNQELKKKRLDLKIQQLRLLANRKSMVA